MRTWTIRLQKFENAKIEETRREQSESHESSDEQF
jgi:hypothetical protein